MFRPLDKLAPRRTLPQRPREIGLAEYVAEKGLGITGDPAVALRDRAFGIHGDELVGTVFLPDAGQPRGRAGEVMDQRIKRTERHARRVAALDPDIEKPSEKFREFVVVEVNASPAPAGWPASTGRFTLKTPEPELPPEQA